MQKMLITIVITAIVIGAGAFYGGIKYQQTKSLANQGGFANLRNLSPEERQSRIQQFGQNGNQRGGQANRAGFVNGEILSKDEQSLTLKLQDGGSKIVLLSPNTQIMQSTAGSADDLTVGKNLIVNGAPNQDGSVTAQMIQIRPEPASDSVEGNQ